MKEEEKKELIPQQPRNMLEFAEALYKSGMFPQARSPYGVLAIIEYGRELGIPPVVALQNMAEIQGRICISAQLLLALALQKGVSYRILESNDRCCKIEFRKGDRVYISTFTIEEAERIGLTKRESWKHYPSDMLFARCVSRGIKRIAPDVGLGITTLEEMEGVSEEVEISEVAIPEVPEAIEAPKNEPQIDEAKKDTYEKIVETLKKLNIPMEEVVEAIGKELSEMTPRERKRLVLLLKRIAMKETTWDEAKKELQEEILSQKEGA